MQGRTMAATMMVKNHPWPESSRIWAAYRWSYLCLAEGSQVFWTFLAQDNWQNKEHWESHSLQPRCSWAGSDTCSDRVGMALPSCPPCHTTRLALASLGDKVIYLSLKPPVRMTAQHQSSWTSCGHLWRTAEHRKETPLSSHQSTQPMRIFFHSLLGPKPSPAFLLHAAIKARCPLLDPDWN